MNDINFKFLPTQWEALTTTARDLLYGGARGGGKSVFLRYASILWALYVPGLSIYLFRKKYNDLFQNHIYGPLGYENILRPFIDAGQCKITYSPAPKIEFFHGRDKPNSVILLRHCQHDSDTENYRGAEMAACLLDEAGTISKFAIDAFRRCLRVGSHKIDYEEARKHLPFMYDGYFPRMIGCTNPGGVSHGYFRQGFVEAAPPKTIFKAPENEGGMDRIFIPSLVTDNTFLMEEDPNYINILKTGTEAEVRMNLYGDWSVINGSVFGDVFDKDIHVLKPFVIPRGFTIDRAYDYGSTKPFSVVYIAESDGSEIEMDDGTKRNFPRGTLFQIDEIYGWNGEVNTGSRLSAIEIGRLIAEKEANNYWGGQVRPGPSDWQIFESMRGGQMESIHDLYIDGYNSVVNEYRNNNQQTHIRGTQELFTKVQDKSSGSRIRGLNLVRTYLKNSMAHPMEEKGLFFFNKCIHTIRTLPMLIYDETNNEDVDTDLEDHLYDALRYRVQSPPKRFSNMNIIGI